MEVRIEVVSRQIPRKCVPSPMVESHFVCDIQDLDTILRGKDVCLQHRGGVG